LPEKANPANSSFSSACAEGDAGTNPANIDNIDVRNVKYRPYRLLLFKTQEAYENSFHDITATKKAIMIKRNVNCGEWRM
jgi:hypothetical protein